MSKKIINKKIDLSLLVLVIVLGIVAVGESDSAFSDSKKIESNRITTGEWTEEKGPNKADHGDVIINEIHWPGSLASANDQWIELFNTTGEDISLKNWIIENAGQPKKGLKITANPTIKAGGYLLITRRSPDSAESALATSSNVQNASLYLNRKGYKQLVLKEADGREIDRTPENNSWPEGEHEEERYFSMQRQNQTEKAGTSTNSWKTCDPDGLDQSTYWKEEHHNVMCGTPRHPNQPDVDPSLDLHSVEENENNEKEDDDNSDKKKKDESKDNDKNKEDEEEADDKELDRSEEDETAEGEDNHKDDNPSEEKSGYNRSGDDEDEDLSNNADGDEVDENEEDDEKDTDAEDDEDNAGDGESDDPDEDNSESGDTENENNNKDDNTLEEKTDNDESDDGEDEDEDENDTESEND